MVNNNKINIKKIRVLLVICFVCVILLLYNFFRNEYYYQAVDLERIEKIKLVEDIPTIRDFQPEGMKIDWKSHEIDWQGKPSDLIENLSTMYVPSRTDIFMTLYKNREKASQDYLISKKHKYFRTQVEKVLSPNDAYCISKVIRLRDSDFGGLTKTNEYRSEVVIIKNNLVISIYSYNYYDKSGNCKQIMIDTIADYLEKLAAKERTP